MYFGLYGHNTFGITCTGCTVRSSPISNSAIQPTFSWKNKIFSVHISNAQHLPNQKCLSTLSQLLTYLCDPTKTLRNQILRQDNLPFNERATQFRTDVNTVTHVWLDICGSRYWGTVQIYILCKVKQKAFCSCTPK